MNYESFRVCFFGSFLHKQKRTIKNVVMQSSTLISILKNHQQKFHPIVPFNPQTDKLFPFNFTETNKELTADQIADTEKFANYINQQ